MARNLAAHLLVVASLVLCTRVVRAQQSPSSSGAADLDFNTGEFFTKLTATFAVGGAKDGWFNISQAAFAQELLPAFLADNPATIEPWVKANTSELQFTLKLELLGLIPKTAKVTYLAWELAKPLAALFPAPATLEFQVAATGNTSAEGATTQQVAASFLVTFPERPTSVVAASVTAATFVVELQKAADASGTVLSANAGLFIRNLTSISPRLTRRLTNGSFSFVVPSRQTERQFTLDPLRAQLTRPSYLNGTLPQQPADNQTAAGDANATSPVASSPYYPFMGTSPTSDPWIDKPLSLKVPLMLLALKAEDVSSFFLGTADAYNVSASLCRLTDDPCCKSCDPSKSCVRKPMCLPKDPLTLNDILCFADSYTPCWQRGWGCGQIGDVANGAAQMYDYSRGFWGGDSPYDYSQSSWMWSYPMGSMPRCGPWRLMNCLYYSSDAGDCNRWGMCQVVDKALCAHDKCTRWDEAKKTAVTDPCCSNSGDCSKVALPLTEPATCEWDGSTQSCRQQRVDNCTAAGLDMEAAVLCVISNTMKANAAKPLPQVANELCNATVSGACAVPSSVFCSSCLGVKSRLTPAMARVSAEADACKRQNDASPHYSAAGVNKKHTNLLRAALQMVLMPATMCGQVSTALLANGTDGKPLLSAANVLAHGGAWVCRNSAIAKQLCDKPGGSGDSNNGTSDGMGNSSSSSSSFNSSSTSSNGTNITLDCSQCGRFMEEFANLTAAGKASYTPSSVTAFCIEKVSSESQQGGGGPGNSGQDDVFAEPDQCKLNWEKQRWCGTEMGCEYQQRCVPYSDMNWGMSGPYYSGGGNQQPTTACAALNASACSAQDDCMFMPQPGPAQAVAICLKVANAIRNWGLEYVLNDPFATCAVSTIESASTVKPTCGAACRPAGYCQDAGAGDPQCVGACANCKACVSRVNATMQAVRSSTNSSASYYGMPYQDNQQLSLAAFKQCMQADTPPTQPGTCMTRQTAVCAAGEQTGSCSSAAGCGTQQTCAKFDPVKCDPTRPKGQGVACQVAKVCNAIITPLSILSASKLCGPGLLEACANPTSPLCLKCVNEAEDLQNRLRSLSKFQCRRPQYYMPTQGQECINAVRGWLSSKLTCSAALAPQVYQAFQAAADKSHNGMNSYYGYYDENTWGGFCSNMQAEVAAPGSTLSLSSANTTTSTVVKATLRHLLQTNSTNTSSPVNGSSEPAVYGTSSNTTNVYEPPAPMNPPSYCQSCNQLPAWVYDSNTPGFSGNSTGASNCSAANNCTQRPAATLLPLLQTRRFDAALNSSIESKHLPAEAVRIAARKVWSFTSIDFGTAPLPAGYGCDGWSSNTTNITCRVDAQVAINLLVGHLLETYFPCNGSELAAAASPPWSSCNNFSVAWLPPNRPCPADNTTGCTRRTFAFQLQQYFACPSADNKTQALGTNTTGNTTSPAAQSWCQQPMNGETPTRGMYRYETFTTGGPLAPAMGLASCPPNATMCAPPALLVPVEDDLRLLAALPDDSYGLEPSGLELVKVQGWDTTHYTKGQPFCPLGIQPCPPPGSPGPSDNYTYINTGGMTSYPSPGSPGGYPNNNYYGDIYSNYPEGTFQPVYDSSTGNITYPYQPLPPSPVWWYMDEVAQRYAMFDPQRDWNSWGNKDSMWTCFYQTSQVSRGMAAGYVERTAAGLAGACVDFAVSNGSPGFVKKQWTGEINCSPWDPNSCCTPTGLKPGNQQTCEALSNCQFSASCSVALDNCYEQFKGSLTNASFGESHAVCDPSCSFQPVAQSFGGAAFSALPTLRTAPDGSSSVVDGVCYNKTLWSTCTAKTTAATCKLWSYGNNTCTWQPVCQRVKAADYSCTGSSDSCCLGSQHAKFDESQEDTCKSRTGDGGKACRVGQSCFLIDDPCSGKTTPWDCLADATCQFVPSFSSRMGGVCTTQRQVDPCRALDATECAAAAMCMPADRCITDHCPDASDSCCALGDDPSACTYKPGCQVASTCLPALDDCNYHLNVTTCGAAELCRWVEMSPPPELMGSMFPKSDNPSDFNKSEPSTSTFNTTINSTCANDTCANFNGSDSDNGSVSGPGGMTYGACVMDTAKHPCASATDDASCTSLRDGVGRPLCYSQTYCVSGCSRCLECLNVVKSSWLPSLAAVPEAQASDAVKVSAAFALWCHQQSVDNSTCDSIASQIVYSPRGDLARRPGMLCSLAGQCSDACDIPVEFANGTASRQPLDKCANDGTAAGNPVPPPSDVTGACSTDADCSGGAWCSWAADAVPVCSCSDGWDNCQVLGTCNSDRCPLYADLISLNTDKTSCANDAACPSSPVAFVCQLTAYTTFTCANSVLNATSHPGFCVEAAPSLVSAALTDTADVITVSLSAAANSLFAKCDQIFTAATMIKLGPDALCVVDDEAASTLDIHIMNMPSVVWGSTKLELTAAQSLLTSSKGSRAFAGTSAGAIALCTNCPAPVALASGPQYITKPCPGSALSEFRAVVFDASSSFGTAAAPITSIKWELVMGDSSNISASVDRANAAGSLMDQMLLQLDGATLANSPAGKYMLLVTATNSLGNAATSAALEFAVADAGSKPSIRVFAPGSGAGNDNKPAAVEIVRGRGLKLFSTLQIDSVCKGSAAKVNYLWTCVGTAPDTACTIPAAAAAQKQLRLEPQDFTALKQGVDYTFTLTAGFAGSTESTAASAVVRVARSPLVVQLSGPMGAVKFGSSVSFDASKSTDPDNPAASLGYSFTCEPKPCFNDTTYRGVFPKRSAWVLDTTQLKTRTDYTIFVTVSPGSTAGSTDDRKASTFLTITPEAGNPPTGIITRFCGFDPADYSPLPCPAKHNPSQDLIVTLDLDDGFEEADITWSAAGGGPALQEGSNAKGLRKSMLLVKPAAFPSGSIKLAAHMAMPGVSGSASITIPLNTPPSCPKPPCFVTDVNNTTFPAYTFVGSVNGWIDVDGDTLSFEFGQVIKGEYVAREAAGPSTSYVFKGFEPGSYQLYACAIDSIGARTCSLVSIHVNQPAAQTAAQISDLVKASVAKIDVQQLASTGDVSAVTAALQEFASIASFAAAPTAASDSSPGIVAAPAPVSAEVVAKQNTLLTTLTSVMNTKDPASMGSSLNAAGAVSKTASGLSGAAGDALLAVVDGFVNANKGSKTADVSDAQVSTATKVLSKGLKAAYVSSAAPARRRALLQSADPATAQAADAAALQAAAAYKRLASSTGGLMTLIALGTAKGATRVAGADICLAVARDDLAAFATGRTIGLDCSLPSTAAAARRHLLAPTVSPSVTLPAGFAAACAADTVCQPAAGAAAVVTSQFYADPATFVSTVKDWPAASLVGPDAQPGTTLTAVTGVLPLAMNDKTSGSICSTVSADCTASVLLPLGASFNPTLPTVCLKLDALTGDPSASLQASTATVAVVPGSITGSTSVSCATSSLGNVVAVQYTPRAVASPPPASTSLADNSTANDTSSTPAAPASPSPSPQLGVSMSANAYTADISVLTASDVTTPVAFAFTFSNFNYDAIFKVNGALDEAATADFKLAVKKAFLLGVASKTGLVVGTASSLQVNRVNITSIRPGSVLVDLEFWPPATASASDLALLTTAVTTKAADFFATPELAAAYGAPQVAGTPLVKYKPFGLDPTTALAVGIGVGVGGALLVGVGIGVVIVKRRRAQTLSPEDQP